MTEPTEAFFSNDPISFNAYRTTSPVSQEHNTEGDRFDRKIKSSKSQTAKSDKQSAKPFWTALIIDYVDAPGDRRANPKRHEDRAKQSKTNQQPPNFCDSFKVTSRKMDFDSVANGFDSDPGLFHALLSRPMRLEHSGPGICQRLQQLTRFVVQPLLRTNAFLLPGFNRNVTAIHRQFGCGFAVIEIGI